MRRYANRPDLLAELGRVATSVAEPNAEVSLYELADEVLAARGRRRLVAELLTAEDVTELVASFEAGTPKHHLAARYKISESSVKRLLRRQRALTTTNK